MKLYWFALCFCLFFALNATVGFAQLKPGLTGTFKTSERTFSLTDATLPSGATSFNGKVWYPSAGPGTATNETVATGSFPVLAFGHGFNMSYTDYTQICKHLASWGYIVIAPDVQNGFSVNHYTFAKQLAACIKFMLNQNTVTASPYFGRVANKKGCFGHSMGGGATYLVPAVYPQIDAVSGMAAAETNPSCVDSLAGKTVPFQVISGSSDNTAPENTNQQLMYNSAAGQKQWVSLKGGAHCKFSDGSTVCDLVSSGGSLSRPTQIYLTKKYLTAFFQYHLRADWDMRTFICGDSAALDVSTNKISNTTNIVCPNCTDASASIMANGSTTLCAGQTVTLNAGSPGAVSYLWNNGATTQTITVGQAGSYSVKVVDAQTCVLNAPPVTITVDQIAPFSLTTATGQTSFCAGQTLAVSAPAGFAAYQWSNGAAGQTINVAAAGNYAVTVTNANGCTATASVTLTEKPLPAVSFAGTTTTLYLNETLVLKAQAQGATTYQWTGPNGFAATSPTVQIPNATPNNSGVYTVTIQTAEGCTTSASVQVRVSDKIRLTKTGIVLTPKFPNQTLSK